jgi:hypothetical protein
MIHMVIIYILSRVANLNACHRSQADLANLEIRQVGNASQGVAN